MSPLCFAYYCSGHGYGHATRVSAFACHLLNLPESERPAIYIVSSAPKHVFADSLTRGALYRFAEIDPVIVQPLAYRVDRQKSVEVLKSFLSKKDAILEVERQWLVDIHAHSVLSDAAFLGCLAAKAAGIPSILITNFTFDSVYSYLSTSLLDASSPQPDHLHPTELHHTPYNFEGLVPDIPVPPEEIAPLVEHIYTGYRCADLLLLLPGFIPIPSFSTYPALPAPDWVDPHSNKFHPEIVTYLSRSTPSYNLHPPIPFLSSLALKHRDPISRSIIHTPLLVRTPTSFSSVYTPRGRSSLFSSIGIPPHLHDPKQTKVLVVSFGGQVFRRPSKSGSRSPSRSRDHIPGREPTPQLICNGTSVQNAPPFISPKFEYMINGLGISGGGPDLSPTFDPPSQNDVLPNLHLPSNPKLSPQSNLNLSITFSPRLATSSHIWIPGAPPASKPLHAPTSPPADNIPTFTTIPPTPNLPQDRAYFDLGQPISEVDGPHLLPDSSWIAIVCGVSKEQWNEQSEEQDSELPEGFFVAPRDVYMPDLTAAADALLGKLGYGTVSECVDSCTPFVYVSRPLFIEEHGLRLLLDCEGVGVELTRQCYEAGNWAGAVEEAWSRGREAKSRKRKDGEAGIGLEKRGEEGRDMARMVVKWVKKWQGDDAPLIGESSNRVSSHN